MTLKASQQSCICGRLRTLIKYVLKRLWRARDKADLKLAWSEAKYISRSLFVSGNVITRYKQNNFMWHVMLNAICQAWSVTPFQNSPQKFFPLNPPDMFKPNLKQRSENWQIIIIKCDRSGPPYLWGTNKIKNDLLIITVALESEAERTNRQQRFKFWFQTSS